MAWDEPDLLQNVKSVNPWLVELVSNMPTFHLSPFSPPRKKSRFMQHPEFPLLNQLPMPTFSGNLLNQTNSPCHVHDSYSPAGIQGARHSQYGLSPCDFPFNKLQSDMLLGKLPRLDHASVQPPRPPPRTAYNGSLKNNAEISCLLTMGNPRPSLKEPVDAKTPHILLFGQRIHAGQQSSISSSASTTGNSLSEGTSHKASNVVSDGSGSSALHRNSPTENSSEGGSPWYKDQHNSDIGTENVNLLCLAL